ncbi:MAG: cytochrome c oxidase assembly factor Coa1 family protein [Isosphaeraceae bacterium]
MENTSGKGKLASVPAEIDRWNWGAFLLNWIWGIGNDTFIALLMFVPLVNLVMMFILGAKGSSWAWRNKKWESIEQFKVVQRKWAKWGVIVYISIAVLFVGMFFAITAAMKNSDAFKLALARVENSQEATDFLGKPVTTGMPMGSIEVSGPNGAANLSFSVSGPKGNGTVYMEAVKELGQWHIKRIELEEDGTGRRIDLSK